MIHTSTIIDFLGNVLLERDDGTSERITISEAAERAAASYAKCAWMEVAMHAAVGYAIAAIQRCPIRIRGSGRRPYDHEEWLWNVAPNPNQSHSEFIARLLDRMFFARQRAALVVPARDSLWVADGWTETKDPGRPTVYEHVSIEGSTMVIPRPLDASEVFVFRVAETSRWRILMRSLQAAYDEMADSAVEAFNDKSVRRWLLRVDQQQAGTAGTQAAVNEYLKDSVGPFIKGSDVALPLFRGFDLARLESAYKGGETKLDVVQIREEAFRVVANCLRIPYSFLEGNVNNFEVVMEAVLSFFVDPVAKVLEDEIAAKSLDERDWGNGGYARVDTTHIRHVDLFSIANSAEKLVGSSIDTPNEIRLLTGQDPVDAPGMDDYRMTLNHETLGGGENNDDTDSTDAADGGDQGA